jgi:general secretion pathway protein D
VLLPALAGAQFEMGSSGGNSKPWTEFKLPKKNILLALKNASVDSVVQFFQKESGITIVKDPALTGQLTVITAKAIPISEAFAVLRTTLDLKGFEMVKDGTMLVIRKKQPRNDNNIQIPFPDTSAEDRTILKVYKITYANASQVARVVNEVFAPAGAPAPNLGQIQFGGNRGGGNNNWRQMAAQMMMNRNGQSQPNVRASSDDFSNTVIVNAPDRDQRQVESLIKQIDTDVDDPQVSKVFPLQYASATDLAPVVQNVLVSNAPTGRGGIGTQNADFGSRFQQAMRFGSSQAAFGQVVADTRTNSLVVTATPDNLDVVQKVISELDKEVEVENTTFVFPLQNAQAEEVASLITQAFGQRQNGGNVRGGNFGNTNNRNTNRNNNNNNNRNNRNNRTGQNNENIDPENENELALDVNDDGELQTNIAVAQGFGFLGGGNQNRNNQPQTQRDANGRIVNTRDLTGQVTAIADPNTNSIIVVTSPENAEIIRNVLDQLDRIPEQVMIETIIVEATLDASNKLGVEWNLVQNNVFGAHGNTGSVGSDFGLAGQTGLDRQGFRYTLAGGALTGFIQALQTDTKFQVLSTPRIFTSNNVEAQINISQRVPYVVSSRQDALGSFTYNYSFEDVGIVLTVTPRITSNGFVTMQVTQTANELQGFTDFNAPIVNQREADTTVSVKDGDSIILGGIMRNTVNSTVKKLPILGDIPILGNLFKSTSKENVKTELLVFLTPHIVRDAAEAQRLRQEGENQMSPITRDSLNKVLKPLPPTETQKALPPPTEKEKTGNPK